MYEKQLLQAQLIGEFSSIFCQFTTGESLRLNAFCAAFNPLMGTLIHLPLMGGLLIFGTVRRHLSGLRPHLVSPLLTIPM